MRGAWVLLVAAACSDGDDPPGTGIDAPPGSMIDAPGMGTIDASPGVGEPPELMGMTLLHNQMRAAVQTTTPLPALQWDPSLAATATAWVTMCTDNQAPTGLVDHNAGRSAGHPYYIGENIYASGGTATAQGAMNSWGGEMSRYNPTTGACNGTCGHYTQIVWRTTLKVGCALHRCAGLMYPSTIVCNYGPGGNSGGPAY